MAKGTVNKVILLGRLGQNPDIRQTQQGTTIANLALATNDGYGDNEETTWHKVVVFGKSAEAIQKYATKGSQLFIEGRIRNNKYQDKQGNDRVSTEVMANSFQFVGGDRKESNKSSPQNYSNQNKPQDQFDHSNFDDDIPF